MRETRQSIAQKIVYENNYAFELAKKQLYNRANSFEKFEAISEEQLKAIEKKVKYFIGAFPQNLFQKKKLGLYQQALKFLTTSFSNDNIVLSSFDCRILFLILTIDPELNMYKKYLSYEIQSVSKIDSVLTQDKKGKLLERKQKIKEFEQAIRKEFGFFDNNLLKFEEFLWLKRKKEKKSALDKILALAKFIKSFSTISDETIALLKDKAEFWNEITQKNQQATFVAEAILHSKSFLNLESNSEKILFFLNVIDPELDILFIAQSGIVKEKMQEIIENFFGFYSKEIVLIEEIYKARLETFKDKKMLIKK